MDLSVGKKLLGEGAPLASLKHRDFRFLVVGSLFSDIGSYAQVAALFWLVKVYTKSNTWVGVVNLAQSLPVFLLVVFAGYLADHTNKKKLILACQATMGVSALCLAIVVTMDRESLFVVIFLVLLGSTAYALGNPAMRTLPAILVPHADLLNAYALDGAQGGISRIIGSAAATSMLYAGLVGAIFFFNAATFLIVIGAIAFMSTTIPLETHGKKDVRRELKAGLKYVTGRRWMLVVLGVVAVTGLTGFALPVLLPAFARDVLKMGVGTYGLLITVFGLGGLLAVPVLSYLKRRHHEIRMIKFLLVALGAFLMGFAFSPHRWVSYVMSFLVGGATLAVTATANTLLQARSAPGMRGRVSGISMMTMSVSLAIGGQIAGFLADLRSALLATMLAGLLCLATALVLIFKPSLTEGAEGPTLAQP